MADSGTIDDKVQILLRLATDVEMFFLLASTLFAVDAFLYLYNCQKLTLAGFQWSYLRGNQIGEVLLFLLAFSFVTTVVAPMLARAIQFVLLFSWKPAWLERLLEPEEKGWDSLAAGYVRLQKMEDLALSDKEYFYLLAEVKEERQKIASSRQEANRIARIAFSFVINAGIDFYAGFRSHATLSWKISGSFSNTHSILGSVLLLLVIGFCVVLMGIIKPLFAFESPLNELIRYKPLAEKLREERDRGIAKESSGMVIAPTKRMRTHLELALALCVFLLTSCSPPRFDRPVIGAKNFTEQVVLGELLAQHIEAKTGLKVERRFYLAGSYIAQQAMISGRIDAYVEYTGTALTAILKQPPVHMPDPAQNEAASLATVRRLYAQRYGVVATEPLGFENTFAMIVRPGEGQVRTLSQAVSATPGWRLGVGYEFEERPDGLHGLEAAYGLRFAGAPRTMDLGLLYRALGAHQVDIIAGNSTDGPIAARHLQVLADDKHYFPSYQAVPLVRKAARDQWPQRRGAFADHARKISADDMRAMNEAVDGEHRDVVEVVRAFRAQHGL